MQHPGTATLTRQTRHHVLVMPVSGREVAMRKGDTLELQLRQLGGSGAAWGVSDTPPELVLERDELFGPGAHVSGAFSTRLLRFRATRDGTGRLRLTIGRAGTAEPHGRLEVHVRVAEG